MRRKFQLERWATTMKSAGESVRRILSLRENSTACGKDSVSHSPSAAAFGTARIFAMRRCTMIPVLVRMGLSRAGTFLR